MARVAVVTGGTRGIGEAISVALKQAGYKVAANYCGNDERAKAFTRRPASPPTNGTSASFEDCAAGVEGRGRSRADRHRRQQCRHHPRRHHAQDEPRQWDEVLDTNLGGCFNMCKAVWDGMLERQFGRVVNIGSINGQAGQYGQVNYAAAKSGIHGFTKALAQEGAPKGITVNAIAPGYIDTDMVAPRCRRRKFPCWRRSSPASRSGASGKAEDDRPRRAVPGRRRRRLRHRLDLSINGGQHMY
jgi:acetoacetyl-CoA reductase